MLQIMKNRHLTQISQENKKSLESNPFLQRMAHVLPTQYGLKRIGILDLYFLYV